MSKIIVKRVFRDTNNPTKIQDKKSQIIDFVVQNNNILRGRWFNAQQKSAPIVILLAPNQMSSTSFEDLVSIYRGENNQNDIHVLLLDFCGNGLSDGKYRLLGLLDHLDLKCVIEQVRLRLDVKNNPIILHGMSVGSIVAAKTLSLNSNLAQGLILQSYPSIFSKMSQRGLIREVKKDYGARLVEEV